MPDKKEDGMIGTGKHRKLPNGGQIWERISNTLDVGGAQKVSSLIFSVFAFSVMGFILVVSVPIKFKESAEAWALAHWIINLIWAVVAGFGWKTLPDSESRQLSREERARRLRLQTIWFRFWKGGFLLLFSTLVLLLGLGLLKHLSLAGWIDGLAVAVYVLVSAFSFWQRRLICRVMVEGWSSNTRWGRLMLRLVVIGPVTAATTCSIIGIALARSHILPRSIAAVLFGTLGVVLACVIVPFVVYDFSAAWIHLQIRRAEAKQVTKEGYQNGSNQH